MRTLWLTLMSVVICMPISAADDLIDALVPTDPRSRLESGTGMVYGSSYSPREQDGPPPESEATELVPESRFGGGRFGDLYKGLRSSLYEPTGESDEDASTFDQIEDDPFSHSVSPILLGKPEQRDGVWYEDDLSHR